MVRVRFAHDGVAAPARLAADTVNLWPEAFVDGLPEALKSAGFEIAGFIHAAAMGLANGGSPADPVAQLHPLAAALRPRRMAVVTTLGGRLGLVRTEDGAKRQAQSGLSGYVKSLARERSGDAIRVLDIDPRAGQAASEWIVAEALSADRTTEVGFDGRRRWTASLEAVQLNDTPTTRVASNDVVLVTGGAGEIGSIVARAVASRTPKAVVLAGRRAPTSAIQALLADLGRNGVAADYVSTDVTDSEALRRALEPLVSKVGPVTIALHVAGAIDDSPADRKTTEQLQEVMRVKTDGADAVLAACPQLRRLVYFSSWAGRFGNSRSDRLRGGERDARPSRRRWGARGQGLVDRLAAVVVDQNGREHSRHRPGSARVVRRDLPRRRRGYFARAAAHRKRC